MNYWEERYKTKGKSGRGSIGYYKNTKWKFIEQYSGHQDVIDLGCGDLSFWDGKECRNYIGIDISPIIIKQNEQKRPKWRFICQPIEHLTNISANDVFCLDVLFHILDEAAYWRIIDNIASACSERIFISTWTKNPLGKEEIDNLYQIYRSFLPAMQRLEELGFSVVDSMALDEYNEIFCFEKIKRFKHGII